MDFLALAAQCGPEVHPETTAVIVQAESGFNPLAIRDNTARKSYAPATKAAAERLVQTLYARGHRLALGYMQVTTPWLATYRLTPGQLLDGCMNLRIGTAILAENYRRVRPGAASDLEGLNRALSVYWSGRPLTGGTYVNHLHRIAGTGIRVSETPGVSDGVLASKIGHGAPRYRASTATQSARFVSSKAVFFEGRNAPVPMPSTGGIFFR